MLTQYLRKRVSVVTVDGRNLVGVLHAADQLLNIVLTSCIERVGAPYDSADNTNSSSSNNNEEAPSSSAAVDPIEEVQLGVMMLRGADIVTIAVIDVYEEAGTNVREWRGRDMPPVIASSGKD